MAMPLAELPPLLDSALRAAKQILLFSDFDGTLTPIRKHPDRCHLAPSLRRTLTELSRQAGVSVGIISGRQIDDLRNRVAIPGIFYVGNHGLEVHSLGLHFREPHAVEASAELDILVRELKRAILPIPGAWVEHKGLTATVHFRAASEEDLPRIERTVRENVFFGNGAGRFVIRPGKAVLEIRPAVNWNKASAVLWLAKELTTEEQAPLILYFGDDVADEEVFSALPDAITVCVAGRDSTFARYVARDPEEVNWFLDWLLTRLSHCTAQHCFGEGNQLAGERSALANARPV